MARHSGYENPRGGGSVIGAAQINRGRLAALQPFAEYVAGAGYAGGGEGDAFGQPGAAQPTGEGGSCGTDLPGGEGEPWAIISTTEVAAAALAANTSLVEVFDASQSTQIDTDNKLPDDFLAKGIQVYVGVQSIDDGGIETVGILNSLFVLESRGAGSAQQQAIWPLATLGTTLGWYGGFGTSTGGVSGSRLLSSVYAPWNREYSTQGTYSLDFRLSFGDTTLNVVVVTTVIVGYRYTNKIF